MAAALGGCSSPDSQSPVETVPTVSSNPGGMATSSADSIAVATTSDVSRERVLRAMTCQIVLAQMVGTKMSNASTGLPADLEVRIKASAVTPWEKFALEHAQAAGVTDDDRASLIASENKLSSSAEDRAKTVDTVRGCLDNQP